MSEHKTIKQFDSWAFAFAGGVGPWVAPIAPALVFGSAFAESMKTDLGDAAIAGGIVAGVGLVVAGAFTSHNAIERGGWWWIAAISYVALEIVGLWKMAIDLNMQVVGTVLALITFLVYISRAGASQINEAKAKAEQSEADRLTFERQRILAEDERRHKREMEQDRLATQAKIEATKSQHSANVQAETARIEQQRIELERERERRIADDKRQAAEAKRLERERQRAEIEAARIICDGCGREFDHQNGLNAHKQHCNGAIATTKQIEAPALNGHKGE